MWPRKQLDIGWSDLAFGFARVFAARRQSSAHEVVGEDWVPPEEALVTLSVRTGWDLLLAALELPAGSEVIMSAVTIPDMVRIVEKHGLVAVPVDVDAAELQPSIEQIERSITPRTRAILVAHLFGTRARMGPIIEVARQHDLLVIEDCAQAYVGDEYAGNFESDVAMFSFGPIKTATALGGGVIRVRDPQLRARMAELHEIYPLQSRWLYFKRLLKYTGIWLLGKPFIYELMVRTFAALGRDYDEALGKAAHSFSGGDFFAQIRRRPSAPLERLLARRIASFDGDGQARLGRRTQRGDGLLRALPAGMVIGEKNPTHTYWVMPIRVKNAAAVIAASRKAGFDVTARSSLIIVAPSECGASWQEPPLAPWLAEIVFLPSCDGMPDDEWQRLVSIVEQVAVVPETAVPRELVAMPYPATVST